MKSGKTSRMAGLKPPITVIQWADKGSIGSSTGADVAGACYFALSDLGQYANLTNVYDQYKINLVEVYLVPTNLVTSSGVLPPIATAVDFDDATAWGTGSGIAVALNYENVVLTSSLEQKMVKVATFRPRLALAAYSGAFTSYANTEAWVDAVSPSVQHYGFKWYLPQSTTITKSWHIYAKYTVSFREVR